MLPITVGMTYTHLPRELSSGSWPAGPFDRGTEHERAHARLVAQLAAALTGRREQLQLSRAALARRAGVAAHTVGRIEAGQSWPDLGVVARLAHVLGLTLSIDSSGWTEALPAQRTPPSAEHTGGGLAGGPLELGLGRGDSVTSAHVIEAVLHHAPAVRREVERLTRRRADPPPQPATSRTGTRL